MKTDKKILFYRKKIDEIDIEICKLLIKRFKLTALIGKHKLQAGKNISDEEREKTVVDRALKLSPVYLKLAIKHIFLAIIKESKKIQKNEKK